MRLIMPENIIPSSTKFDTSDREAIETHVPHAMVSLMNVMVQSIAANGVSEMSLE